MHYSKRANCFQRVILWIDLKFSPSWLWTVDTVVYFLQFVHNSAEQFHRLLDTDLRKRILIDISGNLIKLYRVAGVQSVVMNGFSRACVLLSCKTARTLFFVMKLNKKLLLFQYLNVMLQDKWQTPWHALLPLHYCPQEARVALGYRLVWLLRFFRAQQPPACTI